MKKEIFLFIIVSFCSLRMQAQVVSTKTGPAGLWQQLGSLKVDTTLIHDDIVIMGPGEFRSLKFTASGGDVQIQNVNVIYQNGKVDQLNIKYLVPAGGESRIIDLKDQKTQVIKIRRVTVWYQSAGPVTQNKPKLSLWGMK